jgi:predicted Zn-dependent protease
MRSVFDMLADHAFGQLLGREVLLLNFSGEDSDFVRFNRGLVRQAMSVRQAGLDLRLIDGQRHASVTLTLAGQPAQDRAAVAQALSALRADLPMLPEDPYLLYCTDAATSERSERGQLPSAEQAIGDVIDAANAPSAARRGSDDLVGVLASGPSYRGFASSLGSRHWHEVEAFNFEWSLVHSADKAVKSAWAGSRWDRADLLRRVALARGQLAHLARPAKTVSPGEYRTYLAPAALDEFLWMLNWNGVSARSQRTKQSCIQRLVEGDAELSPQLTVREDTAGGLAPAFDEFGFAKPRDVALIASGRHAGSLVSPRTAREYGLAANGADEDESMAAMAVDGGALAERDVLQRLGTGIYVGNLWYLNFSDRPNARITGMTRFASFWVEGGEIVAPLSVMRFDDTMYRVLGARLEALTAAPEWILNSRTYRERSLETSRVPGALVEGMTFTL